MQEKPAKKGPLDYIEVIIGNAFNSGTPQIRDPRRNGQSSEKRRQLGLFRAKNGITADLESKNPQKKDANELRSKLRMKQKKWTRILLFGASLARAIRPSLRGPPPSRRYAASAVGAAASSSRCKMQSPKPF